ncbi:MAG TPA: Shiga toxin A subunit [Scandinavium sp.]|jgi:hypothetical protein
MKKGFLLLLCFPVLAQASDYGCAAVGSMMEDALFNAISHDLKIDTASIQHDKTKIEHLGIYPVGKPYAQQLGHTDYLANKSQNGKALMPEDDYVMSFYENEARTVTAKYTYLNKQGKRDVFIATSIMNTDECTIRFNGYITLSREF